jgi:hypothetical protein
MADTASQSSNNLIKEGKAKTCAFYMKRMLPRRNGYKTNLLDNADDLMALNNQEFDYI